MTVSLQIRGGTARSYPEDRDEDYGIEATNWAQDVTNAINNAIITKVLGSAADVASGYADYSDLAVAISALSDGDILFIRPSTYSLASQVDINKSVKIIGSGYTTVIESAAGIVNGGILLISANGVSIQDLMIANTAGTPDYGIEVTGSNAFINGIFFNTFTEDKCVYEVARTATGICQII